MQRAFARKLPARSRATDPDGWPVCYARRAQAGLQLRCNARGCDAAGAAVGAALRRLPGRCWLRRGPQPRARRRRRGGLCPCQGRAGALGVRAPRAKAQCLKTSPLLACPDKCHRTARGRQFQLGWAFVDPSTPLRKAANGARAHRNSACGCTAVCSGVDARCLLVTCPCGASLRVCAHAAAVVAQPAAGGVHRQQHAAGLPQALRFRARHAGGPPSGAQSCTVAAFAGRPFDVSARKQ